MAVVMVALCGLVSALTGCREVPEPEPPPPVTITAPDPWSITIPRIGAHSTLIPLGLDPTGALAVPPVDEPGQAGWWAGPDPTRSGDEVKPGESGPAVIVGHIDGGGRPGVFARLHELGMGDEVLVERADGSMLVWQVTGVETHDKDSFPSAAVYGGTAGPELRLITCGGAFDEVTGHYEDNLIAWAVPA